MLNTANTKLGLEHAMFRGNAATDFGTATEPRAVVAYERATNASVAQTGLHMHPNLRWGASPDGIVTTADGQTGLLEVAGASVEQWSGNRAVVRQ